MLCCHPGLDPGSSGWIPASAGMTKARAGGGTTVQDISKIGLTT
jgi:hypothetical protein